MKLVGLFSCVLSCALLASASKLQGHHKLPAEGLRMVKAMHTMMYQKGQSMHANAHKSFNLQGACNEAQVLALGAAFQAEPKDIAGGCAILDSCEAPAGYGSMAAMFCLKVDGGFCYSEFASLFASGGEDDEGEGGSGGEGGEGATGGAGGGSGGGGGGGGGNCTKVCGCKDAENENENENEEAPDFTMFCSPCGRALFDMFASMGDDDEDPHPNCPAVREAQPDMTRLMDAMCRKHSTTGKYCVEEFMAFGETFEGEKKMAPMCSECIMPVMEMIPATPGVDMVGIMKGLCKDNGNGVTCAAKFDGIAPATIEALDDCVGPDTEGSVLANMTTCTCQTQYTAMLEGLGCCADRVLRIPENEHEFNDKTCTSDADCDTACAYKDYCLEICFTADERCKMAKPGEGQDKSSLPDYPKIHALTTPFKTYLNDVCEVTVPADCEAAVEETVELEFPISNLKPDYYAGLSGANKAAFDACIAGKLATAAGVPASDISFAVDGNVVKNVAVKDVVGFGASSMIVTNARNLHFDCLPDAAKEDAELGFEADFTGGASANFLSAITMATVFATFFLL